MGNALSGIRIVAARVSALDEINALIARSKAHWSWPPGYLEKALALHVLAPAYLRENRCFEVLDAQERLVAFYALAERDRKLMLDNLWVVPERIGQGIGRRACEHAVSLARDADWSALWVLPDPPAESFYRKLGFSDTGERVASRVPSGPVFSVYRKLL